MSIKMEQNQYPVKFFFLKKNTSIPSFEEREMDTNCDSIDFLKTNMTTGEIVALARSRMEKSKIDVKSNRTHITLACRNAKGSIVELNENDSNLYAFVNAIICQCIHLETKFEELCSLKKLYLSNIKIPAYIYVQKTKEYN